MLLKRTCLALATLTLGAFFGALSSALASPASAGVTHSHLYTHNSSACSGHVDPINDVFVESAFWQWVDNHAGHHGGWGNNDSGNQWFTPPRATPREIRADVTTCVSAKGGFLS